MRGGRLGLIGGVLVFATGCGHPSARDYAKQACDRYREGSGRVQVAMTVDQGSAIRDLARSDARAAAAFDPRWISLASDIPTALDLQQQAARLDRFFAIDERVRGECKGAGRDIGDLKP